jgi:hypothetical protein
VKLPDFLRKSEQPAPTPFADLSRFDQALVLLFTLAIYGAHLLPQTLPHLVYRPYIFGPILLGAFGLFFFYGTRLRTKVPWLFWPLVIAYYGIVAAYLWLMLVIVAMGASWVFAVILLWAVPIFLWYRTGNRRLFFVIQLTVISVLLDHLFDQLREGKALVATAAISFLVLGALAYKRRHPLERLGPVPMFFFVIATVVFSLGAVQYQGIFPEQADRIAQRHGVNSIYSFGTVDPYEGMYGNNFMFAVRFGPGTVLSPHFGDNKFVYLPHVASLNPDHVETIDLNGRAGDMPVFDEEGRLYIGGFRKLYRLALEPFRIDKEVPVLGGVVNMVRIDPVHRRLFASQNDGKFAARFDLDDLDNVAYSNPVGDWQSIYDVAVHPNTGRFYLSVFGVNGWSIIEGDGETMQFTRTTVLKDAYGMFMEIDPETDRLFLASIFTGELLVMNTESMEVTARIYLGWSIRYPTLDKKRGKLYVTDYSGGQIVVLNLQDLSEENRFYVGPTARYASLSVRGNYLTIRTGAGVFEIRLDEALDRTGDSAELARTKPPGFGLAAAISARTARLLPILVRFSISPH